MDSSNLHVRSGVAGPPTSSPAPELAGQAEVSRSIRFAGYLIGAVVALVYGVTDLVESIGQIVNCAAQTLVCRWGFSAGVADSYVPMAVTGGILLVIAIVLLRVGQRYR